MELNWAGRGHTDLNSAFTPTSTTIARCPSFSSPVLPKTVCIRPDLPPSYNERKGKESSSDSRTRTLSPPERFRHNTIGDERTGRTSNKRVRLPWLNIAWMEEECRKYFKPFNQLLDENVIQVGIKTQM